MSVTLQLFIHIASLLENDICLVIPHSHEIIATVVKSKAHARGVREYRKEDVLRQVQLLI